MRLPEKLRAAIEEEVARVDSRALSRAAAALSTSYRSGQCAGAMSDAAGRAAYLVTRMPATFAAVSLALRELELRVSGPIRSLLDVGAGPGTAMWAATEILPDLEIITAIERDASLIALGKRLAAYSDAVALQRANWTQADLCHSPPLPASDLVVLSYAFGELPDPGAVIRSAWEVARAALVVIEPGTPAGFGHVLHARDTLIGAGAHIAAPCPHHYACPLAVRNDWCHFSVRLERTSTHRKLKGGELGYEDEKFSYVIASKVAARPAEARIVRHPLKHPGHIRLTLCTPNDLQQPTITKSQKDLYRAARKADWGDAWPPDTCET